MEPCKEIKKIMTLLSEQGKTQKDLTDHLGITQNAFTDWKSGRIKSWNKHLPQIAEFLGVTVDCILCKTEKPADDNELPENVIIYHRDGKTVKRIFTKEEMNMLVTMIDAIHEKKKDI